MRRHAVLRTLYEQEQQRVIELILPVDGFVVPLDECTEGAWATESARVLTTPFALTTAPPVRALLGCTADRQHTQLLVVVDHVASNVSS